MWGALAQSLPDIDGVAALWLDTSANLLVHRGLTHSILFVGISSLLLALIFQKVYSRHNLSWRKWGLFFLMELSVHILLDAMNAYGVGWFEPFSSVRISFHTLFVADPFFSIWSLIAFVALLVLSRRNRLRMKWAAFGISASVLYLLYSFYNKAQIDAGIKASLQNNQIPYHSFITTPTPFNNWLWYIVAASDSGYYIGYRSVFDQHQQTPFHFVPRNSHLLSTVKDHRELQNLLQFSRGYFTLENRNDTLLFNVLRFGQVVGWYNPEEKFVFHYYLEHSDNELVMQRGRFAKWDRETLRSLLQNIKGTQPKP